MCAGGRLCSCYAGSLGISHHDKRNENMPTNEEIINEKLSEVLISRLGISDLYEMLDKARADTIKSAITHMRVARSSMCLKDRAILLNEINLLEKELKRLTK